MLLLTLLIMAVVGLVVAVATGRIVGGLDRPASSLPGRGLPSGPIRADDLERVRFSLALRGYRMDEVDDVLDRLMEELGRRDEEIAELRARWASASFAFPGRPAGERPVSDAEAGVPSRPANADGPPPSVLGDADAPPPSVLGDADAPPPSVLGDADTHRPSVLGEAYESHGLPRDPAETAARRRRLSNRSRPDPFPRPGVPATPPRGGQDEHGGGR
jgi:DivIVA domain-containing protein